jgi:endonuclease YncB( thermonuclease family)
MGIDTWESRTRDLDEKKKGLAAKARNKELLEGGVFKLISHGTGKFGRVLGEIFVSPDIVGDHINECISNPESSIDLSVDGWVSVNDILIEEGHAYDYHGGKKKDFKNEIKEEKAKAKESIKDI